jgi:hypothetical protein
MHEKITGSTIENFHPAPPGWRAIFFETENGNGTPVELPIAGFAVEVQTIETVAEMAEQALVPDAKVVSDGDGREYLHEVKKRSRVVAMISDYESWGLPWSAELVPADQSANFVGIAVPESKLMDWTEACAEFHRQYLHDQDKESTNFPSPTKGLVKVNPRPQAFLKSHLRKIIENADRDPRVVEAARILLADMKAKIL